MSDAASTRIDAFAVTVDDSMRLREGEWDGARGEREIFDWATGEDGEVDWAKAARGFIVADLNPPAGENITRASFKLAIAYVEDGELVGIGNAIRNALGRLPQTKELSDAVRAEAKAKLEGLLEKLRSDHERSDAVAEPDEATAKAWVVEHLLDARKMPRPRMAALKAIDDRYSWLKPPRVDVVFRGLRNLTSQAADRLLHPSDPVRDKSWTTSRSVADQYALAEHTSEDREEGRVGAVLEARAASDALLLNADEMAKTAGIGDVIHPDDGKPLRDMILAEREVIALESLDVVTVHTLPYEDRSDVERSEEEQKRIREEFPALINATPSQMREWSESPFAGENRKEGEARESARDALRRVIALKEKPMAEWTEGDYDDAVDAISFVKRMSKVQQGDPIVIEGREGPSERDASLRDWGHWTDAADEMTADSFALKLREIMALPPVKRAAQGWTDAALVGAVALLTSLATPHVDAGNRVYRTCTMDFALDAEARTAIDRALQIADEIGPRTDAAQVNSIAEQLRADGFADKVTADGRLIVTGYAARTGSQLYGDGKSTWYEYRSEDEVEKSLVGYSNTTFTDDHPPALVTADNWREYARGHVGVGAVLLPPADDGHRYVKVTICVGDVAVIRKMRDGKVELSAGYTTIAVRDPGTDAHGVRYTYRQTDIQINHLALVDQGRAGHRARIYIDGQSAVFEIDEKERNMTTTKKDQMDPEAAMALLDAIKAYAYADSPEAASAAMQSIATALELDPEMVKQHLGGGEMMEMDGVKLLVSKDAAAKIRAAQAKMHGDAEKMATDAAKMATDYAALQGEVSALSRTVDTLKADKALADMRELERQIAPLCPQLVSTWSADKRPDSMTAMRVAAIVDLDPALKADINAAMGPDPAKPAPTFDTFVDSLFRSTIRHASARRPSNDNQPLPLTGIKIDTSTVYGKTATN